MEATDETHRGFGDRSSLPLLHDWQQLGERYGGLRKERNVGAAVCHLDQLVETARYTFVWIDRPFVSCQTFKTQLTLRPSPCMLVFFFQGSNLTIQVLHSTLVELMKTAETTGTPLPRKLHLQLDNCSRENKNR